MLVTEIASANELGSLTGSPTPGETAADLSVCLKKRNNSETMLLDGLTIWVCFCRNSCSLCLPTTGMNRSSSIWMMSGYFYSTIVMVMESADTMVVGKRESMQTLRSGFPQRTKKNGQPLLT